MDSNLYSTLKKSWYIEAYTHEGGAYCRNCVAEITEDSDYANPYLVVEIDGYTPIFASDIEQEELEQMICEHCFEELA